MAEAPAIVSLSATPCALTKIMADNNKTGSIWTIKAVEFDMRNLDRDFAALFAPGMFAAMVKVDKRKAKAVKQPRQKKESQFDSLMKGFKL